MQGARRRSVGVLGGMGPAATVEFLRRIVEKTEGSRDQDHIRLIVDSNPNVPDRSAFLLGTGVDPRPALIGMARSLEVAGADLLVMPCNTAHAFHGEIQSAVSIPLLNWPAIVASKFEADGFASVGVLATDGTVASSVYERALTEIGLKQILPPAVVQQRLMNAIYKVKSGGELAAASETIERGADALLQSGADAVLLACTELSWAWQRHEAERGPVVDGMDVVVAHTIRLAGGVLRPT